MQTQQLRINRRHVEPDIVLLEMAGVMVEDESKQVQSYVDAALRENRRKVILDLSRVERLDSLGVGTIVSCSAKLRKSGGELRVAGTWGVVDDLLKLTRVDQIVAFYTNPAAAAGEFNLANE